MAAARKVVLIHSNFATLDDAERVGRTLVEEGLAAAVNIQPGLVSIYAWEGRTEQVREVGMTVKTAGRLANTVMERLTALHPYRLPAILVLPVVDCTPDYCAWIERHTGAR